MLLDRTRFRSSPFIEAANIIVEFAKDTEVAPDFIVNGGLASGSAKWYGAWGKTPNARQSSGQQDARPMRAGRLRIATETLARPGGDRC
ncbi:MAG: hypothetical protein WEB29_05210 [Chloroflexota bacterium]